MKTIPKNAKRIAQLKAELTQCMVYTLGNYFLGKPCEPEYAWKALAGGLRARLTDNENGVYTVHVNDNCWYELRAS